jgi:Flp pilus assembly protein TadG
VKTQKNLCVQTRALKCRLNLSPRFAKPRFQHSQLICRIRAFYDDSKGGSLVEMAVALPMLLAVVTGIFTFGIAFYNQLTLTSAVGAGAQYLQVIRTSTSDPCADTFTAIKAAAPGLNASKISLKFNLNGTAATGDSCPGDQVDLVQGSQVTVSATYPCSLAGVYGAKFTGSCELASKVSEYEY